MNGVAWAMLGLAAIMSLADWVAVTRENSVLEYVSKPAATAAFALFAVSVDVEHTASWTWLVVALVFCLFGDVFLMLPGNLFVPGLASFAVAQVMFAVGFAVGETSGVRWLVATVVAIPVASMLARRFVGAIRSGGHTELVVPVSVYVVVITTMAVAAVASGSWVSIAGAIIFMLSDALIAETRFVKARPWQPVGIMVTYHLALAGLVLGLL
ncbi:unannotated protein [freshwater metagenome]|uniref:Unannotated protein n=1 Tax=freshwater metagenome TaxID=449393 RepID=A0A6J6F6R6_9ZZZZ|nr:hypothetical protein [Actinomycetota bacterium]